MRQYPRSGFVHRRFWGDMIKAHTSLYAVGRRAPMLVAEPVAYYQLRPLELVLIEDVFRWGFQAGAGWPIGKVFEKDLVV